jgi:tRNA modification GTPase
VKTLQDQDTIVALATAPGRGAIAIVRLSGPDVLSIFKTLSQNKIPLQDRQVSVGHLYDDQQEKIDFAVCIYFKGPRSFTGDDVIELQLHASDFIVQKIIRYCCALGARLAQAGEFSKRAYLNGKSSLTQLEATADLIAAQSEAEVRAAIRTMQGDFAQAVKKISKQIMRLRMMLEAHMDFTDEDISPDDIDYLADLAKNTVIDLDHLIKQTGQGSILRDGLQVVIIGKPNVGKSSLMNALAKEQRSIVSDIAGTTRDIIRDHLMLGPLKIHLADTAGLCDAKDVIEQQGIAMAKETMKSADIVWLMIDSTRIQNNDPTVESDIKEIQSLLTPTTQMMILENKIDQTHKASGYTRHNYPWVCLSTKNKIGLDALEIGMKEIAGLQIQTSTLIVKDHHIASLTQAQHFLHEGYAQFQKHQALELFADDCYKAQMALEPIHGKITSDDILGQIFSNFCIGK